MVGSTANFSEYVTRQAPQSWISPEDGCDTVKTAGLHWCWLSVAMLTVSIPPFSRRRLLRHVIEDYYRSDTTPTRLSDEVARAGSDEPLCHADVRTTTKPSHVRRLVKSGHSRAWGRTKENACSIPRQNLVGNLRRMASPTPPSPSRIEPNNRITQSLTLSSEAIRTADISSLLANSLAGNGNPNVGKAVDEPGDCDHTLDKSAEPQLFRINPDSRVREDRRGLRPPGVSERSRHPGVDHRQPRDIFGDCSIIGKEFSGFEERAHLTASGRRRHIWSSSNSSATTSGPMPTG